MVIFASFLFFDVYFSRIVPIFFPINISWEKIISYQNKSKYFIWKKKKYDTTEI